MKVQPEAHTAVDSCLWIPKTLLENTKKSMLHFLIVLYIHTQFASLHE